MNSQTFKKLKMPDSPGVYFFLGPPKRGEEGMKGKGILYIGKATSLKDRVKSYFSNDLIETRGPIIVDMVFKADNISWEKTDSVLEAIILEASLIKKYQPKYNTKEKSDKSFNYVCITKEELPKVILVRGRNLKNQQENFSRFTLKGSDTSKNFFVGFSKVYGPFTNSTQLREALKLIRRIFPFLDDKAKNYLEFYKQINLIPDLSDRKMYLDNIKNIKLFFSGKKKEIFRNLKKEMIFYAKKHEFEKAGEIKRQLFAIQHINDIALVKQDFAFSHGLAGVGDPENRGPGKKGNSILLNTMRIEAYDIAHMSGKNMVGVMTVILVEDGLPAQAGEVEKSEYKKFKIRTQNNANDTGALEEVLERRFLHKEWPYPFLLVVDGGLAQIHTAQKVLKKFSLKIPVVSVLKDEHHKPKALMGDEENAKKYKKEILLINSEAHRFAIAYHKNMRNKNFLK